MSQADQVSQTGWQIFVEVPGKAPIELPPGESVIGRSRNCVVQIAETTVSRQHAIFVVAPGNVRLRDLGSSNGTFVNGERVDGEIPLADGDRVVVGEAELVLRMLAPLGPAEATARLVIPPMTRADVPRLALRRRRRFPRCRRASPRPRLPDLLPPRPGLRRRCPLRACRRWRRWRRRRQGLPELRPARLTAALPRVRRRRGRRRHCRGFRLRQPRCRPRPAGRHLGPRNPLPRRPTRRKTAGSCCPRSATSISLRFHPRRRASPR